MSWPLSSGIEPTLSEPTLSERAYIDLRAQILNGDFKPGQKLAIQHLQAKLGYSSSPLREALSRLSSEGLVLLDGNRGFSAAPISVEDILDITFLRITLEQKGLLQSMKQGRDEWEAGIVAAFHRLELIENRINLGKASRDDAWTSCHRAFHMSLIAATPSPRLLELCGQLFDLSERYRRLSSTERKERRNTLEEHRRISKAVLERDKTGALELVQAHYEKTTENVVRSLSSVPQAERPATLSSRAPTTDTLESPRRLPKQGLRGTSRKSSSRRG